MLNIQISNIANVYVHMCAKEGMKFNLYSKLLIRESFCYLSQFEIKTMCSYINEYR